MAFALPSVGSGPILQVQEHGQRKIGTRAKVAIVFADNLDKKIDGRGLAGWRAGRIGLGMAKNKRTWF